MQPAAPGDASADQIPALREQFPGFRIWKEAIGERVRYIARSQQPGLNPHTVVTDDVGELRAALETAQPGISHP
jgi:hypothetical protein